MALPMKQQYTIPYHHIRDTTTTTRFISTEERFLRQAAQEEIDDDEESFQEEYNVNDDDDDISNNPGLASVIAQGLAALESTAAHIESKTRRISLLDNESPSAMKKNAPSHRQLSEGHRILQVLQECLDDLCDPDQNTHSSSVADYEIASRHLMILDEPISILNVQVNRDLKLAKVYWTLPYGLLLDDRLWVGGGGGNGFDEDDNNHNVYTKIMKRLEPGVETHGQKLLSKHVHTRLRSYYPPRLRLVPATNAMVQQAVEEMLL